MDIMNIMCIMGDIINDFNNGNISTLNDFNIRIAGILKKEINELNSKSDFNLCLVQPGLDPLSIIGKSETEIIKELKNNIISMAFVLTESKEITYDDDTCKELFGIVNIHSFSVILELIKELSIAKSDYSNEDKETSRMEGSFATILDETLDTMCNKMLLSYMGELGEPEDSKLYRAITPGINTKSLSNCPCTDDRNS